jgi:nucleotide-binding universal stress UspA family protein
VRENGSDAPNRLARAAAIELREATGERVPAIVHAAAEPDVVALVLGARGIHGGPQPAGSTALEVITRVAKPVVVVPPRAQPLAPFRRILVPLEGTAESSEALAETIELATRADLEIVALHVHSPASVPAFSDQTHHEVRAWEREFISRYAPRAAARLIRALAPRPTTSPPSRTTLTPTSSRWRGVRTSPRGARVVRQTMIPE